MSPVAVVVTTLIRHGTIRICQGELARPDSELTAGGLQRAAGLQAAHSHLCAPDDCARQPCHSLCARVLHDDVSGSLRATGSCRSTRKADIQSIVAQVQRDRGPHRAPRRGPHRRRHGRAVLHRRRQCVTLYCTHRPVRPIDQQLGKTSMPCTDMTLGVCAGLF